MNFQNKIIFDTKLSRIECPFNQSFTHIQVQRCLLHRESDWKTGPNEPDSMCEPGPDGRGIVVRGKNWLILGNNSEVTRKYRILAKELYHQPVLTFSTLSSNSQYRNDFLTKVSRIQRDLMNKYLF